MQVDLSFTKLFVYSIFPAKFSSEIFHIVSKLPLLGQPITGNRVLKDQTNDNLFDIEFFI